MSDLLPCPFCGEVADLRLFDRLSAPEAERVARQIARAVFGTQKYENDNYGEVNGTWRAIGSEVVRREAALRERAERAEAEVARLRARLADNESYINTLIRQREEGR